MRKEKFTALWVLALLFLFILFVSQWVDGRKSKLVANALKLNQTEIDRINTDLNARNADDCKISREWYGFRCVEKNGKVFRVYM